MMFRSDKIIEYSGGNPRHVLQLMEYAYNNSTGDCFDNDAVDKAINDLANNYKRFLTSEDYQLLYEIDHSSENNPSEHVRKMLYHLALLEYNDFWWKSHPVIRILPSYKKSKK